MNRRELIAAFEGRIIGGEMHHGEYIHVPQEEAEEILELLKAQEPLRCKNCLHYHHGAKVRSGTVIPYAGFCGLLERVFLETDYCSYHTGAK